MATSEDSRERGLRHAPEHVLDVIGPERGARVDPPGEQLEKRARGVVDDRVGVNTFVARPKAIPA